MPKKVSAIAGYARFKLATVQDIRSQPYNENNNALKNVKSHLLGDKIRHEKAIKSTQKKDFFSC